MTTRDISFRDTKVHKSAKLDVDGDSVVSFATGPITHKPLIKFAWSANDKVNNETFHRMLEEYREAKRRELDLDLKAKQLAAQLARTEEAAKRALLQTDATAKGGAAQKLLDAERSISKLREENAELRTKLAREKKKSTDAKTAHDETKRRLESALRDQRAMAKRLGELERKNNMLMRKPEDEFWGEEAGRRFVVQQEELVALREENAELRKKQEAMDAGVGGDSAHLESQLQELTALVKFYEKKITTLAEQQLIQPQDDIPGGPNSGDWILEEHIHNDEMFLLDRKNGKLYTNPGEGTWPRPVGVRTGTEVRLGSLSKMDRFLDTLDHYLQSQGERLRETFNEFDIDNSGFLDRRELSRLIQKLMPDAQARDVEELRTMLDVDGDGQITYDELVTTIQEAYAARNAAKMGKNIQVNDTLERVRDVLRHSKKMVQEAFDEMDSDHDGCLYHMEVVRLLRRFLPDMYQKEVRFLLGKLQEWDVTGEGRCSFEELYQAMELAKMYRVGRGMAGLARAASPARTARAMSPSRLPGSPGAAAMSVALLRQSAAEGLKEGFLRERVHTLEAELKAAQLQQNLLEAEAKQVAELRRDLTTYKVRIEELHKDMMKIDVINKLGSAEGASGDDRLKQAWETASMFKKRYMEHKAELDGIKASYTRMQAQLDETHRLLNDEHRRRFHLEDQLSHANMELQRVKDLEARLQQERVQRVKLEREFLELQNRAFNAPTQQLVELRQLQTEVFALRREKVLAEQNENAVRQELSRVREQLDGMSLEHYRAWQRDHDALKRRIVELELELQAALDKLEVYRRTQPTSTSDILLGDERGSLLGDHRPDADKSAEELRIELAQLRDVWRVDRDELKKLHQVLEIEEGKCMEARAALEEAHREMDRLRRDFQDQIRALQRELELRDERIRRLELQLRGAYMGVNKATRAGLRDSTLTDPDDLSDIGEMQNLLELHVTEASVFEEVVGKEPPVFFTVDFFMHETQATQVVASNTPAFNTVIQFVVEQEPFLVEYLDTHVLELELNRARGWDYDPVGVARVPLRQLLDDVDIGAALGHNIAWHHIDVFGADNRRIGRVRYGFRFRKPIDALVKQYRDFERSKRPSEPDPRDPAFVAVQSAALQPKTSSYVKVVVVACRHLVPPTRHAVRQCRPYVHYRFPGHRDPHTTKMLYGHAPDFHDEATWLISRSPELDANFRTREMHFMVFDDSAGDDPQRGIIGVAVVPLSELSRGMPVEGTFRIINPLTREEAGQLVLGMGWHNPLRLPGEAPAPPGDELRAMLARGPQEVPYRATADSDLSLRGYVNPQGGSGFGLEAETGAPGRNVPRDEFGQPLRPGGRPQQATGLAAEVARADISRGGAGGHGHGLDAEVQSAGRLGGAGGARAGLGLEAEVARADTRSGAGAGLGAGVGAGRRAGAGGEQFGLAQDVGQQDRPLGLGQGGRERAGTGQHGLAADVGLNQAARGAAGGQRPQTSPFGLGAEGLTAGGGGRQAGADAGGAAGRRQGGSGGTAGASFGLTAEADDDDEEGFGLGAQSRGRGGAPGGRAGTAGAGAGGGGGGSLSRAGSTRLGGGGAGGAGVGGGGGFGLAVESGREGSGLGRGASGRLGPGPLGEAVELGAGDEEDDGSAWTSPLLPLPGTMLLSGGSSDAGRHVLGAKEAGRSAKRYADAGLSPAPISQRPAPELQVTSSGSILARIRSDPQSWPDPSTHVIVQLDQLELTPLALSDPSLSNLFLMHAFLEVPDLEATCTSPPVPGRPGKIALDYTVAYILDQQSLASRRAVAELLDKLTGEGAFIDVRLFSAPASSRPAAAARAVASCEMPLAGMWSGRQGDVMQRRVALVGDEAMGAASGLVLGHVLVTVKAAAALAELRR